MEMNSEEDKGFIIDLSNTKTASGLVAELSSILELPEIKNKAICLKLGEMDLKQSQLLSIKALIESTDATIASIVTDSQQTIATAETLNLKTCPNEASIGKQELETEQETQQITDVEIKSEKIDDISEFEGRFENLNSEEISEIIPMNLSGNFRNLAEKEGLIDPNAIKYVPLDTKDVIESNPEENEESTEKLPTRYMTQTLRSGQTLNEVGNVVIIGDAHPGSEIIAGGDITVWGVLGGIAHAGVNGNTGAKIRALKLNAIQIRIGSLYARRNDTINIPYVQKTGEFTPEEARIDNKQIVIYKTIRRD